MLAIDIGRFAGKLLIRSEHRAQRVEDVLAGLLARTALTQGARHLRRQLVPNSTDLDRTQPNSWTQQVQIDRRLRLEGARNVRLSGADDE